MRLFPNVHRRREQLLKEFSGCKILDVGCGRAKLPGAIGIDRRVRETTAREVQLDINHDLLSFPWPIEENSFDLVHCAHVLEHLPPTATVIEEIYRVLKPGGVLFIECPHFSWCEAYRHHEHCHFFTSQSFDYFYNQTDYYKANFRVQRREIFFDDITYALGIGFLANRFPRAYERHFAFIFPASSFCVWLQAIK
jgi:ubiquinone/menaquinone biosynthesis C-methylase UbiE